MLTGDNQRAAAAVGQQVGLAAADIIAEVLPADKAAAVRRLQDQGRRRVLMVGDGINDAPALAQADSGLAIGAGADIAIAAADVVLLQSRLSDVVGAVQLSRAVRRNIKQNLCWAFGYNIIGIPLAAGALLPVCGLAMNPMAAAAAMALSSFCVVSNALRLDYGRLSARRPRRQEVRQASGSDGAAAASSQAGSEVIGPITDHKEETIMQKTIHIQGMMCAHCTAHVKQALEDIPAVQQAEVSLELAQAVVDLSAPVEDETLRQAVAVAGYEVTGLA
jgi:Cu2+-exporting ATPase